MVILPRKTPQSMTGACRRLGKGCYRLYSFGYPKSYKLYSLVTLFIPA